MEEKLAIRVNMGCRATLVHEFRTRWGFKQCDVNLTKEQSLLTKIFHSFEGGNMQRHYNVLRYGIDLYFHDYKFPIEIDENVHRDRNIDY